MVDKKKEALQLKREKFGCLEICSFMNIRGGRRTRTSENKCINHMRSLQRQRIFIETENERNLGSRSYL